MRVVIADDSVLLREGLARLLTEAGIEVVGFAGDAVGLLAGVAEQHPDVAIVDIRMPPAFSHEGAEAAEKLRALYPDLGILLLSQSVESRHALELARTSPRKFGYLLKDRVLDVSMLIEAVQRVAAGGTVLDPDIVAHFLGRRLAYTYEVVEFLPEAKLVMRTAEGPFPMETTYTWEAMDDRSTRMTMRNRGEPIGFSSVVAPFTSVAIRSANRKDLAKLKDVLESA